MYLLGYDIGSSSVKASLIEAESGKCIASAFYPKNEAPIIAKKSGWAEQDPSMWLGNLKLATADMLSQTDSPREVAAAVKAIGISYQMHGLVCVDKDQNVLRPAIIWCDSRAIPYGRQAWEALGSDFCLQHLLNSPGNFTAAKLAWVKENEPDVYNRIWKIMLPGDYIAMKLTGRYAPRSAAFRKGCSGTSCTTSPARNCWTSSASMRTYSPSGAPPSASRGRSARARPRSWACRKASPSPTAPETSPTTP